MTLIEALLNLLIGLAGNGISELVVRRHQEALDDAAGKKNALKNALATRRNLREEIAVACSALARDRALLSGNAHEDALWRVLSSDSFQNDLAEWISRGAVEEGAESKSRLVSAMRAALSKAGAQPQDTEFLEGRYFDAIERMLNANPVVAHWRQQITLDYLREQVSALRLKAEEASGNYSAARKSAALQSYCDKALKTWDIIDLSNLPEGDVQLATQTLLLRQLYLPLRVLVEAERNENGGDGALPDIEAQRNERRQREARGKPADLAAPEQNKTRHAPGERLAAAQRLVILGDPGGGKTTLLRWMATAYLLRYRHDAAFRQLPDIGTLPEKLWLPVLIRCRDLGDADLCRSFPDFLTQHLYKTELTPEDAAVMRAVVLAAIAHGEALLLIDGLDEITNPLVRTQFCQEVERTAARYPNVHIVVTSRIVGYRDMPYRMGTGFEHAVIAELTHDDKQLFARRWIEVTEHHQPEHERRKRTDDLLSALEASNRIQQLAGNPMLLTTLALVKRKVGKLPSRRTKLYQEAVSVLLNFNPQYETIDEGEAIPQLEYVAWEMCRQGVQRLPEDELLALLDGVRREYPNVRAIRRREPETFLKLLEARSSILIKSGGDWSGRAARERPIWEFRHLTFQEYLAARALIDGRYPQRDRLKTLAEHVSPLAVPAKATRAKGADFEVAESWRETLRMLVADCSDDDVDAVLDVIAAPLSDEDAGKTALPRLCLAARCLADEPNVSESMASSILTKLCAQAGMSRGPFAYGTPERYVAWEVAASQWAELLQRSLARIILSGNEGVRDGVGALLGELRVRDASDSPLSADELMRRLSGSDEEKIIAAMEIVTRGDSGESSQLIATSTSLCRLLTSGAAVAYAAAHAVMTLSGGWLWNNYRKPPFSFFPASDLEQITAALIHAPAEEAGFRTFLVNALGNAAYRPAVDAVVSELRNNEGLPFHDAAIALGKLAGERAVKVLVEAMESRTADIDYVVRALGETRDPPAAMPLTRMLCTMTYVEEHPDEPDLSDPEAEQSISTRNAYVARLRATIITALAKISESDAVETLTDSLDDEKVSVRVAAAAGLRRLGVDRGTSALRSYLQDGDPDVQDLAVEFLAQNEEYPTCYLLARDFDGVAPFVDLMAGVSLDHIESAAEALEMSPDEVRERFRKLANELGVQIALDEGAR